MHTHDMLQAMCKQALEHQTNYMMRKLPGQLRSNSTCPGLRPNPREVEAILAAPAARTMAELPPKFLAVPPPPPPHPDYPVPAPPVPIPTGTVLDTTLNAQISAVGAEPALEQGIVVPARLDRPLVVGGQTVLAPPTLIFLRARIIGPGPQPNSVRVGITTGLVQKNGNEGGYELKSDELVFTVASRAPVPAGVSVTIPPDTKLRFILGSNASSAAPVGGASPAPPARPAPVPPGAAAPPDPQRQPERQAACAQQAFKEHPRGGVELTQALSACTQVK
jgi:hypothetical protein